MESDSDDLDLEELFSGLRVEEVKPILDLLDQAWAAEKQEKSFQPFPMKFARFRVDRELGRGGFGVVFEAFDPLLGRMVALKVPRPEVTVTPGLTERFHAEARASAGLSHPNVVQVHDAGEFGPSCYIVSELCDGPNLGDWLHQQPGPLSPVSAATILLQLADAVHYAQRLGVLHRDIKPSNILMARPPADWDFTADPFAVQLGLVPKLTDFGLAKLLEEETTNTPAGAILGTPEYMAPEQAEGRVAEICEATDVYSLGAVLYELLVGRPPIGGSTGVDKLRRVLAEEPVDPRAVRPDIPRDLEAITLKCLRKEPQERYRDAGKLATDLRRFLEGKPTYARPLRWPQKFVRLVRRHPSESSMAGIVLGFIAIATFLSWWHQEQVDEVHQQMAQVHQEAEEQHKSALVEHDKLLDLQYAADLREARSALDAADVGRAEAILSRHLQSSVSAVPRSFSWKILWRMCHQEEKVYGIGTDEVYGVGISPDGSRFATASARGSIRLTDVAQETTRELASLQGTDANLVSFSRDGAWLVAAGDDGRVLVFDGAGSPRSTVSIGGTRILSMSLHERRPLALVGDASARVHAIDLEGGKVLRTWNVGENVESVTFLPGEKAFLVGGGSGGIWIGTDVNQDGILPVARVAGAVLAMVGVTEPGNSAASRPDAEPRWALVGGRNRHLALLNLEAGKIERQWQAHRDWVQGLAVLPGGTKCVSVGRDRVIKVWDWKTGRLLGKALGHRSRIWNVSPYADGKQFLTAGGDGTVRAWNVETLGETQVLARWQEVPEQLVAGPGRSEITVAHASGEISVWDVASREQRATWNAGTGVVAIDASPPGLVAVARASGEIELYELNATGEAERMGECRLEGPLSVSFSPKGTELAVSTSGGPVVVIDTALGMNAATPQRQVSISPTNATFWKPIAFSPDGQFLVGASFDAALTFWDAQTLKWVRTLHRPQWAYDFSFDPSSTKLATISEVPLVQVESAQHGSTLHSYPAGDAPGKSIAYARDGKAIIAGFDDGSIRFWETPVGQEVFRETTGLGSVVLLETTIDGESVVFGGRDEATGEGVLRFQTSRLPAASPPLVP